MVFQGFPVSDPPENWKEMEKSVAQILSASGMDAEIQKTIYLARGAVTVDVYAQPKKSLYGPIICECKYWNTAVPQEKVSLIINFIRTLPTFIRTCADECGNPIP